MIFSTIIAICISLASGDVIAVGNNNKQLREFDVATGAVVGSYDNLDSTVSSHDYSPNGKIIATVTYSNNFYVFDTSTHKKSFGPIKFAGGVYAPCVAVSSNGTAVVVAGQNIHQYDINTGKLLYSLAVGSPINLLGVAYSPDGSQFTTVEQDGTTVNLYGNIRQFDSATGSQIRYIPSVCINGLRMVAYSPDGQYFGVTPNSSLDNYVRVFNVATGELQGKYTDPKGPYGDMRCVAFSPDSTSIIAGGADRGLRQYSIVTGEMLTRTLTGGAWINGCAFSFDQSIIAFSEDTAKSVLVIGSSDGKIQGKIVDGSTPYQVKFHPLK